MPTIKRDHNYKYNQSGLLRGIYYLFKFYYAIIEFIFKLFFIHISRNRLIIIIYRYLIPSHFFLFSPFFFFLIPIYIIYII